MASSLLIVSSTLICILSSALQIVRQCSGNEMLS